jgi:hypothetical protein
MACDCITAADKRILVAGPNGLIGAKVVETLLEYGFSNLRCFVRRSSQLGRLGARSATAWQSRGQRAEDPPTVRLLRKLSRAGGVAKQTIDQRSEGR